MPVASEHGRKVVNYTASLLPKLESVHRQSAEGHRTEPRKGSRGTHTLDDLLDRLQSRAEKYSTSRRATLPQPFSL
jgi:hypothetical protein